MFFETALNTSKTYSGKSQERIACLERREGRNVR